MPIHREHACNSQAKYDQMVRMTHERVDWPALNPGRADRLRSILRTAVAQCLPQRPIERMNQRRAPWVAWSTLAWPYRDESTVGFCNPWAALRLPPGYYGACCKPATFPADPVAHPVYRGYSAAMGRRRPVPNARVVTFNPTGACLRLYSFRSTMRTMR